MIRAYQYRCNDFSLLTPTFKKWIVAPLLRFVPWVIPANVVTIISNTFVYAGLYFSMNPEVLGSFTPVVIGLCLFLYLVGDHLDGMQAKRTNTGSALGEFCDHYLDAFNNGMIVFTVFMVFGINNPIIIAFVMVTSYLAHMTVFYEQLKTGWLTFEKIGSLEGVLLSALLVMLDSVDVFSQFVRQVVVYNFTMIELTMIATGIGGLFTFFGIAKRTPEIKIGFWMFVLLFVITAAASVQLFSITQLFAVLTLYASLYIGRIMRGHLVDGVERKPDFVTPAFLLAAIISGMPTPYTFWLLLSYLSFCIGALVYQTFYPLKVYWVWVNAKS